VVGAVIATMSTKSREVIYGGRIIGARIRAQGAREAAKEAVREADRAAAELWSIQMEAYGGPAQPSPTIGQCLNGGYGWLRDRGRHPARCDPATARYTDLETRSRAEMPVMQEGPICASRSHDQANGDAPDQPISVGAS
jgi:hypothetical protein